MNQLTTAKALRAMNALTSTTARWALPFAALALIGTACGSSSTASNSSGSGTEPTTATSADVAVGNSSLGQVLTDKTGLTLYYFKPEAGGKLVCDTGACVATWPLATVSGSPSAGSGLSGQLTTISGPNGQMELAYNSWPLHTYSGDKSPGDVKGQGIGGQWFAATPSLASSGGSSGGSAPPSSSYNPY